jgi:exodeoxyribonuclease III
MRVMTWNINSVRLRAPQVERIATLASPDVICLQEIKCREAEFPTSVFRDMGFSHITMNAQKGMHGVAIASRKPLEALYVPPICPVGEARAVAARIDGVEIHCLYVPAGGDEADVDVNPKFAHKLQTLAYMKAHYEGASKRKPLLVCGDFNVAPGEHDVWSHKQLLNVVSHTPVETTALHEIQKAGGFSDLIRDAIPAPERVFTWWSYRSPDFEKNDRGRRLDHIWATPDVAKRAAIKGRSGIEVLRETRKWERPSDHVPVLVDLAD